jgi:hypothetical protein
MSSFSRSGFPDSGAFTHRMDEPDLPPSIRQMLIQLGIEPE